MIDCILYEWKGMTTRPLFVNFRGYFPVFTCFSVFGTTLRPDMMVKTRYWDPKSACAWTPSMVMVDGWSIGAGGRVGDIVRDAATRAKAKVLISVSCGRMIAA